MRMVEIIEKKRDGYPLTESEIAFFIEGYTKGEIPDYQASALCMAIYFQGMNDQEATYLAISMLKSGDQIDLSNIQGIKVDKHSTGGVGDKTSLVLAPLVACLGIKFAKMSGRGLGHTGGTLDKLESIPGFSISLTKEEFTNQVNRIGLSIIGQTGNLTPADKKLYALRDVTGTVNSIPLIASSIMSKKLASGSDAIALDVKVGNGAFMKDIKSARHLASLMVSIGRANGKHMTAILTDMDQPLGCAIGNQLEVIEAVETLKGKGPKDLLSLCLEIGSYLVMDAKKVETKEEAKALLMEQIKNGNALNKLKEMVKSQGGDVSYIDDCSKFPSPKEVFDLTSKEEGYISHLDALTLGIKAMEMGAGRATKEDTINPRVGIVLKKKLGDYVKKGDSLATLYMEKRDLQIEKCIMDAFSFSKTPNNEPLILDVIR